MNETVTVSDWSNHVDSKFHTYHRYGTRTSIFLAEYKSDERSFLGSTGSTVSCHQQTMERLSSLAGNSHHQGYNS